MASGLTDLRALAALCRDFPDNRFLVSVLSRENQHELCVYARKFRNLLPFGCWWFLNNPSIVEEITRERIEMLGFSFIPQHSDARILEQLIYKWRNTRRTIAPILTQAYGLLEEDGRVVAGAEIKRNVEQLFRGNFLNWTGQIFDEPRRTDIASHRSRLGTASPAHAPSLGDLRTPLLRDHGQLSGPPGLGILKPVLGREMHWSESDYGWIVFCFQMAYASMMPVAGRVMDWLGERTGYALAVLIWSAASMSHSIRAHDGAIHGRAVRAGDR